MVPSNCVTPNQLLKKRTKLQERRDAITALATRSTVVNPDLLSSKDFATPERTIQAIKAHHASFALDLLELKPLKAYCKYMEISTLGFSGLLKKRLSNKIQLLRSDDMLLRKEGVDHLSTAELISANEERGMRTLNQTDAQLRKSLQDWIAVSLFDSPPAPEVFLIVSRIFVNNIQIKA
ncbi:hypothetical protein DSO57_1026106 [Entomophthora muscae]|uniref:Uncharacterized protein n=1 Tax=Entomophthora muscae TaxID=34485 RepID=A0ACC2RT88_9FUNG|nr:hypothetical protein DSO57_1026106 [Entomophthora muscae]